MDKFIEVLFAIAVALLVLFLGAIVLGMYVSVGIIRI